MASCFFILIESWHLATAIHCSVSAYCPYVTMVTNSSNSASFFVAKYQRSETVLAIWIFYGKTFFVQSHRNFFSFRAYLRIKGHYLEWKYHKLLLQSFNAFCCSSNSAIHKAVSSLVSGRSLQNRKMSMGSHRTERPPEAVLYGGRQSGSFVNSAVSLKMKEN